MWLKMIFLNVTRRIEPFLICFQELNLFFLKKNKTPRIELFFNTTQRFCSLCKYDSKKIKNFEYDSKKWFFWMCDSKIFHNKESKHWTLLFNMAHRIEPFCSIWLKNLNHRTFSKWLNDFFNLTWIIEPFFDMTWKIDFFWKMSK